MVRKLDAIEVGDFKQRCLELIDHVVETGKGFVVTKRGRPVARLLPVEVPRSLRGSILQESDLVSPIDDRWNLDE